MKTYDAVQDIYSVIADLEDSDYDTEEYKLSQRLLKAMRVLEKVKDKKTGKLQRDRVVSLVGGESLVGVYWKGTDGSDILFECHPDVADQIIRIFNKGA